MNGRSQLSAELDATLEEYCLAELNLHVDGNI